MAEFLSATRTINDNTELPVIADADSGFGDIHMVMRTTRCYESAGIAGLCIEDQEFPKRNSFASGHRLEGAAEFARKVQAAKAAQTTESFVLIARTEALIAGAGVAEAFDRACRYQDAGADAILVHSKAPTCDEILAFAERWCARGDGAPLVVVPTTYYCTPLSRFRDAGISLVIYANQALRAAVRAIDETFAAMSLEESTESIEGQIADVAWVLDLLGMNQLEAVETALARSAPRGSNGRG